MNTETKELSYKSYTIVVSRIYNNLGYGFRASIYTGELPGENHQTYETYRRETFDDTISDVKRIIDILK